MSKSKASHHLVGGVNSPVRACKSVHAEPFLASHAEGPYLYDNKNKAYVDYVCGFGPILLGHQNPEIKTILRNAVDMSALGVNNVHEEKLASLIAKANKKIEKVRFTNSGGEAVNIAVKLAKSQTQRPMILKFVGQYHGAVDSVLGYEQPAESIRSGIDPSTSQQLLCIPFNDIAALDHTFETLGDSLAGVIIEIISGNMGFIRGSNKFLNRLSTLCSHYGTMLIVDEVMTGFRVNPCGATALYPDLSPDLWTYGKVIGGGLPVGAIAGPKEIMNLLSPVGPVYHAGTFAGHPLVMACGAHVLESVFNTRLINSCHDYLNKLLHGLERIFQEKGVPFSFDFQGGQFGLFFQDTYPRCYTEISKEAQERFNAFYQHMRKNGVLLPPSHLEALFISGAHDAASLNKTLEAASSAF